MEPKQTGAELHKLARAMCSIDLAESQWTQVSLPSISGQLLGLFLYYFPALRAIEPLHV